MVGIHGSPPYKVYTVLWVNVQCVIDVFHDHTQLCILIIRRNYVRYVLFYRSRAMEFFLMRGNNGL